MQKILVTGANGMLGQDLCPILEQNGYQVVRTDVDTLDITDLEQVERIIKQYAPDLVIHCAAYTNVDKAESDPDTAFLINAQGTENIAKICADQDIVLIAISTDYVFAGTATKPYLPNAARNPVGIYAKSKAEGEVAIEKYCQKYYILRTSWLYGHKGKNFIETIIGLTQKLPEIKVIADQFGCPTWTVDLANAILALIKDSKNYGIYHFCGAGQTSWYGLACEAARLLGVNAKINPCTTEEYPLPAKRPKYSVMDNAGVLRDWREALEDYIKLRNTKNIQ